MDNANNGLSGFTFSNFSINKNEEDFYSIIKNKNTVIMQSQNPLEDMLLTIDERKKSVSSGKLTLLGCLYCGFDEKQAYLNNIDKLHNKLLKLENLYIYFQAGIPILPDEKITKDVSELLLGLANNIDSEVIERLIKKEELFNITNNSSINLSLKEAFNKILNQYIKNEASVNVSKLKNFAIKILSWCKNYINQLYKNEISDNNPKCIYYGCIKKHESYFL